MGRALVCGIGIACAIGCGSPSRATDAGVQAVPDAHEQTGAFGGPCTRHTECASGYCVEPVGNTGGADVSALSPMAVPEDLRPLLLAIGGAA